MFRTRMTEAILDRAEAVVVVAGTTPMGRTGKSGELAPTVLFLASEGASYITGEDSTVGCRFKTHFIQYSPFSIA